MSTHRGKLGYTTVTIMDASFAPANPSTRVQGNCLLGRRFLDETEEFRARAAECQHLANCWGGEGKRQYEELARQWRELAELVSSRHPYSAGASERLAAVIANHR